MFNVSCRSAIDTRCPNTPKVWGWTPASLRKQPKIRDATTDFHAKWRLRNERWNSILMTCHYPDLGSDTSSVWNLCARFFRRHLAWKTVVAPPNVGCFLRLDSRRRKLFFFFPWSFCFVLFLKKKDKLPLFGRLKLQVNFQPSFLK